MWPLRGANDVASSLRRQASRPPAHRPTTSDGCLAGRLTAWAWTELSVMFGTTERLSAERPTAKPCIWLPFGTTERHPHARRLRSDGPTAGPNDA